VLKPVFLYALTLRKYIQETYEHFVRTILLFTVYNGCIRYYAVVRTIGLRFDGYSTACWRSL